LGSSRTTWRYQRGNQNL